METQERISKLSLWKLVILFSITAFIGLSFYTIILRNDWMFGLMDILYHERGDAHLKTINYHSQDIESIPLEELLFDSTNVKTTNSLFLINKKHKIDDDFVLNLVNFRDTSLLVDENIIDDLEKLLHDVKQNTNEKYIASTYRTAQEQEEIYSQNPGIAAQLTLANTRQVWLDPYVNKSTAGVYRH